MTVSSASIHRRVVADVVGLELPEKENIWRMSQQKGMCLQVISSVLKHKFSISNVAVLFATTFCMFFHVNVPFFPRPPLQLAEKN